MKRTKLIAGNWKMNTSLADALVLANGVLMESEHLERVEVVLCPPSIWLTTLAHEVIPPHRLPHLSLGAQNMYFEAKGAYTGEISPIMVKEVADYVILGHSERTHVFHEDPEVISKKVDAALEYGLKPIICVGEDKKSADSKRQLVQVLRHLISEVPDSKLNDIVIAYEPVWAIGTGVAATPAYAEDVMSVLRTVVAPSTRILYGGSVDDQNARGFLEEDDCDGLLIGGVSLKLKPFTTICQIADDLAAGQGHTSLHK